MAQRRSSIFGPDARPVALPTDVDDPAIVKASGQIQLPMHIRWSGPAKLYDLNRRQDRGRVYEQVLREGTEEDVRYFIIVDELIDLWDDLVLPRSVRRAWAKWILQNRHLELAC